MFKKNLAQTAGWDNIWSSTTRTVNAKFRYVRYKAPSQSEVKHPEQGGQMAELKFYSGNVLLKGKVLGALNGFDKSMRFSPAKAFDEDNLSYYEGPMDDSWVGLDLGAPYDITEIQFALRNDDNYIKPGDLYELFYHDNQGWVSLGKQEADTIYVKYKNVPENALLWLHNHSGGNEERIFTYEDNEALWW